MDDRISGYASAILDLAEAEGELSRVETEFLSLGQAYTPCSRAPPIFSASC